MRKLLIFFLFLIGCSEEQEKVNDTNDDTNPVYLDENGVTIKARDWAVVGDVGIINGIAYTIVDGGTLKDMIENGDDVTRVCTSRLTNMNDIFYNKTFNQDISSWDVSNVTNMSFMFSYTENFNQDISNWDVSNVTNMYGVFNRARAFNKDISSWDVSNVTDMSDMFLFAENFNQDISSWDVSNTKDMQYMFSAALSFNQDISSWDISNVENVEGMFNAGVISQDLSSWDASKVVNCKVFVTDLVLMPISYWPEKLQFMDCN